MDGWGKAGHQGETWAASTGRGLGGGEGKAGCQSTWQHEVGSGEQSQCLPPAWDSGLGSQSLHPSRWKGLRGLFIQKYLLNSHNVWGTGYTPKSLLS